MIFSKNHDVVGADINPSNVKTKKIDATDKEDVLNFINNEKPDVVINTIALSSYFICEKKPELCQKLNFETAKNIYNGCKSINAKMVLFHHHIYLMAKTDIIQRQTLQIPDINMPYLKLGLKKVLESKDTIVIRPESLYGYDDARKQITIGTNTFESDAKIGYPDLLRCPVYVDDVPRIISLLLEKNQSGIFHIASSKKLTWIHFLTEVAKLINATDKLKIVDTSDWILQPPHDSSLNISKIESLGIKTTSFREGIQKLKKKINNG